MKKSSMKKAILGLMFFSISFTSVQLSAYTNSLNTVEKRTNFASTGGGNGFDDSGEKGNGFSDSGEKGGGFSDSGGSVGNG